MTYRTIHNPSRYLSASTRAAIKAQGIDLCEYVSNIESKLRIRGESELAEIMLSEIRESMADEHDDAARR